MDSRVSDISERLRNVGDNLLLRGAIGVSWPYHWPFGRPICAVGWLQAFIAWSTRQCQTQAGEHRQLDNKCREEADDVQEQEK